MGKMTVTPPGGGDEQGGGGGGAGQGPQYGQVAVSALGPGRACPATVIAFCPCCQLVARAFSVRANWRSALDPTSAGHFSCPGSTGLGVHAGQGSLPPSAAIVAGPIWPHLVGPCGGLRLKNPVGTGLVKVSAHTTHNIQGGGGTTCRSLGGTYVIFGGCCPSGGALGAGRGGAGSSPAAVHRRMRPPIDPFEYRWRRALLQVCGATTCFLFGARGFLGVKKRRDLHPIRRYRRWRRLL